MDDLTDDTPIEDFEIPWRPLMIDALKEIYGSQWRLILNLIDNMDRANRNRVRLTNHTCQHCGAVFAAPATGRATACPACITHRATHPHP